MSSIINFSLHKIYLTSFKSKLLVYSYILQNENTSLLRYISSHHPFFKQRATTKQEKNKLLYTIKSATMKDIKEIMELIRSVYLPNDPLIKSYKLNTKLNQQLLEIILSTIYEDTAAGYTLIAKNPKPKMSPQIYGVCLCGINTPATNFIKGTKANVENQKLRHLLRLWHHVAEKPCLFTQFGVNELFEIALVTTHPLAQNQGIATELIKEAINLAKQNDAKLIRIDCSSFFTSLMCMKLGMKEIHKVYFNEYVDERDNVKLRQVEHPHKSFITYALDLRPECEQPLPYKLKKKDQNLLKSTDKPKETTGKFSKDLLLDKMALLPSPFLGNISEEASWNINKNWKEIFDQWHMKLPGHISTKRSQISNTHSIQKTCEQQNKSKHTSNSSEVGSDSVLHENASEASIQEKALTSQINIPKPLNKSKDSVQRDIEPLERQTSKLKTLTTQNTDDELNRSSSIKQINKVDSIQNCSLKGSQLPKAEKQIWLLETEANSPLIDSIKNHIMNIEDKQKESSVTEKFAKEIESIISHFLSQSEYASTTDLIKEADKNTLYLPSSNSHSAVGENFESLIDYFYSCNRNVIQKLFAVPQTNHNDGISSVYRVTTFNVRKNKDGNIEKISLSPEHYTFMNDITIAANKTLKSTPPGKYIILLEKITREKSKRVTQSEKTNVSKTSFKYQDQIINKNEKENMNKKVKYTKNGIGQSRNQLPQFIVSTSKLRVEEDGTTKKYLNKHGTDTLSDTDFIKQSDEKYLIKTSKRGKKSKVNRRQKDSKHVYDITGNRYSNSASNATETQHVDRNDKSTKIDLEASIINRNEKEIIDEAISSKLNKQDWKNLSQKQKLRKTIINMSKANQIKNVKKGNAFGINNGFEGEHATNFDQSQTKCDYNNFKVKSQSSLSQTQNKMKMRGKLKDDVITSLTRHQNVIWPLNLTEHDSGQNILNLTSSKETALPSLEQRQFQSDSYYHSLARNIQLENSQQTNPTANLVTNIQKTLTTTLKPSQALRDQHETPKERSPLTKKNHSVSNDSQRQAFESSHNNEQSTDQSKRDAIKNILKTLVDRKRNRIMNIKSSEVRRHIDKDKDLSKSKAIEISESSNNCKVVEKNLVQAKNHSERNTVKNDLNPVKNQSINSIPKEEHSKDNSKRDNFQNILEPTKISHTPSSTREFYSNLESISNRKRLAFQKSELKFDNHELGTRGQSNDKTAHVNKIKPASHLEHQGNYAQNDLKSTDQLVNIVKSASQIEKSKIELSNQDLECKDRLNSKTKQNKTESVSIHESKNHSNVKQFEVKDKVNCNQSQKNLQLTFSGNTPQDVYVKYNKHYLNADSPKKNVTQHSLKSDNSNKTELNLHSINQSNQNASQKSEEPQTLASFDSKIDLKKVKEKINSEQSVKLQSKDSNSKTTQGQTNDIINLKKPEVKYDEQDFRRMKQCLCKSSTEHICKCKNVKLGHSNVMTKKSIISSRDEGNKIQNPVLTKSKSGCMKNTVTSKKSELSFNKSQTNKPDENEYKWNSEETKSKYDNNPCDLGISKQSTKNLQNLVKPINNNETNKTQLKSSENLHFQQIKGENTRTNSENSQNISTNIQEQPSKNFNSNDLKGIKSRQNILNDTKPDSSKDSKWNKIHLSTVKNFPKKDNIPKSRYYLDKQNKQNQQNLLISTNDITEWNEANLKSLSYNKTDTDKVDFQRNNTTDPDISSCEKKIINTFESNCIKINQLQPLKASKGITESYQAHSKYKSTDLKNIDSHTKIADLNSRDKDNLKPLENQHKLSESKSKSILNNQCKNIDKSIHYQGTFATNKLQKTEHYANKIETKHTTSNKDLSNSPMDKAGLNASSVMLGTSISNAKHLTLKDPPIKSANVKNDKYENKTAVNSLKYSKKGIKNCEMNPSENSKIETDSEILMTNDDATKKVRKLEDLISKSSPDVINSNSVKSRSKYLNDYLKSVSYKNKTKYTHGNDQNSTEAANTSSDKPSNLIEKAKNILELNIINSSKQGFDLNKILNYGQSNKYIDEHPYVKALGVKTKPQFLNQPDFKNTSNMEPQKVKNENNLMDGIGYGPKYTRGIEKFGLSFNQTEYASEMKCTLETRNDKHLHDNEELVVGFVQNKKSESKNNVIDKSRKPAKYVKLDRTRSETNAIKKININQSQNFDFKDMQPKVAHLVETIIKAVQDLNNLTTSQLKTPNSNNKVIKTRWIDESGKNYENGIYKLNLEDILSIKKKEKCKSENIMPKSTALIIRFAGETEAKKRGSDNDVDSV